jgi:protein-S-isoprenylcysteine O-methyltransferase Ste14
VNLRKLRLRAVWLLVVPFLILSRPTVAAVALGVALAAPGLWIRGWSAGTIHKDRELTTSGPYAFTRNPLYVGSFLIGVGVAVAGGHWIWPAAFLLFYGAVYSRTMAHEKRLLTDVFGDHYREYAANVPAFLPRATPYRPGEEGTDGFQWARYRRNREYEAALGAVAAFGFLLAKALWAA